MRRLADSESVKISYFTGISHLQVTKSVSAEFKEFELHTTIGQNNFSFCHMEWGDQVTAIFDGGGVNKGAKEMTNRHGGHAVAQLICQQAIPENPYFNSLRTALTISKKSTYGIAKGLTFSCFPLAFKQQSYSTIRQKTEHIKLDYPEIKDALEWFELLSQPMASNVHISARRIEKAIFERDDPEDSILDAFIAIESMFTSSKETTKAFSDSVSIALNNNPTFQEAQKLYSLRSCIAHGKKVSKETKSLKPENIDQTRLAVINISIRCLKFLLGRQDLLPMRPSKRVDTLRQELTSPPLCHRKDNEQPEKIQNLYKFSPKFVTPPKM